MIKRFVLLLILFGLLLTACGEETVDITPTPFDADSTAVALLGNEPPAPTLLAELLESPELFENQYVQVSGQYAPRPLLVCNSDPHPSPATWELQESEDVKIPAGGFNSEIRSLISQGISLTVNGYWRKWEGPVGCGKQAVGREIWYLKVTELVSPDFLALSGQVTDGLAQTPAPGQPEGPIDGTLLPPDETPATAVPGVPITSTVAVTNTLSSTPTAPPQPGLPTGSPTPTSNDGAATAVATPTSTRPNPTNTPAANQTPSTQETATTSPASTNNPGGSTPQATPTVAAGVTPPSNEDYTILNVDTINPDNSEFGFEVLGALEKHNWTLNLDTSEMITISVMGGPNMNMALVVIDEVDNELVNQNNAPAGQLETTPSLTVDPNNAYIIQVYETNGLPGDYSLIIEANFADEVFSARGVLADGQQMTDTLPDFVTHFWYFHADAGEVVDIISQSGPDFGICVFLMDVEGDPIADQCGEPTDVSDGAIRNLTIPQTGLYLVRIEEFSYAATSYSLTLDKH